MELDKIKLLYGSFISLYREAPENLNNNFSDRQVWEHYHKLIDQLNVASKLDFNDCKIEISSQDHGSNYLYWYANAREYRSKLNDLLSRLHTLYFSNDPHPTAPLQSGPFLQQNISNKAEAEANVQVSIMLNLNNQLHKAKENAKTEEEKGFVDSLIQKIDKIKNYIEFLLLVINTAKQFGISIDRIATLFGNQ